MKNNLSQNTKEVISNEDLQLELADQHHTCICGDGLDQWRGFYTCKPKVLFANLSRSDSEADQGRFVFYKTKCGKCKNFVMHGESASDYRATGKKLIKEVSQTIARRLEGSEATAKSYLQPSIKRFITGEKIRCQNI